MKIIDDSIPSWMQNQLHSICLSPKFYWQFLNDSTFPNGNLTISENRIKKYPSFCHLAIMNGESKTKIVPPIISIIKRISDEGNLNVDSIHRVRFGMYLPIINSSLHNNIHTDMEEPHTVCLYYVNDSDGDTFFFDDDNQIIERITPKKGRMVIFDGSILHASSMPVQSDYRISLNINYINV